MPVNYHTVDEYIAGFPEDVQRRLKTIRKLIATNAPEAIESISYAMPAYKLNRKPLVYFAAFTSHIGFYATPSGHAEFNEKLSRYKYGKGSVRFPLDEPLPLDLIEQIILFRVIENSSRK